MNNQSNPESVAQYITTNLDFLKMNSISYNESKLEAILKKQKENNYIMSILGSMKAGKSTFVNALIARDLMPNENAACTLTTTEIRHKNENAARLFKTYRSGKKTIIEGENLSKAFHEEVKHSREGKETEAFCYEVDQTIHALEGLDGNVGFHIVDTPGLNEMDGLGIDRKAIEAVFDAQLMKTDYIVYVLDYKYYKAQENVDILNRIAKERPDIIKNNRICFVLNKIDLMTYKDGTMEDTMTDVKKLIATIGVSEPVIFTVSSKKALLARLIEKDQNLAQYEAEIEAFRPTVQKEVDGEVYDVKIPMEQLKMTLFEESNLKQFEESIVKNLFNNAEQELHTSIKKMEEELAHEVMTKVSEVRQQYEQEEASLRERREKAEAETKIIEKVIKEFNEAKQRIYKLTQMPSRDEVRNKECYEQKYLDDEYVYPRSDYNDTYSSESSARSAARSKYNRWKNSVRIDFERVYKEYSYKLRYEASEGNYYFDKNTQVSAELENISLMVDELEKHYQKFSGKKIISTINVMPQSIMSLNYDNSQTYLSDMYDNSVFIDVDSEERYVSGMFGGKYKDVYVYDISDAMRNQKDDILHAINSCSLDFFGDFWNKKYAGYLAKVSEIAHQEVKKAADMINAVAKSVKTGIDPKVEAQLEKTIDTIEALNEMEEWLAANTEDK